MIFRFAAFEFDSKRRELRRDGVVLALEPQVYRVLAYLLTYRDRAVAKAELLDACWPDEFVSEAALTRCIRLIRRAVNDDGAQQQVIKTLRGHGYRFVAAVTAPSQAAGPNDSPAEAAIALALSHAGPPEGRSPSPTEVPASPGPPSPDANASAQARSAERRHLTVMFCDLADSTHLASQLDPESWWEVVRSYQAASSAAVEHFAGHVAQHLGDGLMVYFGWPQAHEDDAQRAVRAALGILAAMGPLNTQLAHDKGIRLAVRIGIHTGLVVVGEVGQGTRQEHLALGETPHLASRLEGVAAPDSIAISASTYQLVQGYFVCEDLGPHMLKGIAAPVPLYRVLGVSGAQSRFDVSETRGLTPLVGRESEVLLLLDRWQQVKEGQGQVVVLSGEAGIGKSRLAQVFKERIADMPHVLLECRSSPYFQNTALYPIIELLQRLLNCNTDDPPDVKVEKLEQGMQPYQVAMEEAVPLLAAQLLVALPEDRYPPLNLSPQRQRQKTFEMIVAMLLQQSKQQPVLFILEDLHWTDPSTLELLNLLLEQTPTAAICVLLTCRPGFDLPWRHRSYLTQMTLNRLSRNQIERMAERVVGGKRLPVDVLQQIVEKTDGVPLYVEEMTKAVLESGRLQDVNGQYELVGALSGLAIPTTLQDSLMARLDRLDSAKSMAQIGATIGRQFSYELLQAVSPVDEATLQRELGRLVEAELVYQRGMLPQATYTFKHALIQDTAYQSLLKSSRQQIHQQIAQVLEQQFPETLENQPELLAHHYTEAGLITQAVPYWQLAGKQASERSAYVEAIAHLTKGLELLETLPETPERLRHELAVQIALGPALTAIRGYAAPQAEQLYAHAHALCQQMEEAPELLPVLLALRLFYHLRGKLQTALTLAEQCLTLAERVQNPPLTVQAHIALGHTLYYMGECVISRTQLEQGLSLYNPQLHRSPALGAGPDSGVMCLATLAWTLWHLGYPQQAVERIGDALNLAHKLSHPLSEEHALSSAAIVYQLRREGRAAQEHAKAALAISTERGFRFRIAWGTITRGWALAEMGQQGKGIAQIRQGLLDYQETGAEVSRPWFLALLAEAYGKMGQMEEGLAVLAKGLTAVSQIGQCVYETELHRLKGVLLLQQTVSNGRQAETCFRQAIDIARRQQAKSLELRAATSLARLWQQQGKRQAAYDLLAPVYEWFTEGFDTADLQEARATLEG